MRCIQEQALRFPAQQKPREKLSTSAHCRCSAMEECWSTRRTKRGTKCHCLWMDALPEKAKKQRRIKAGRPGRAPLSSTMSHSARGNPPLIRTVINKAAGWRGRAPSWWNIHRAMLWWQFSLTSQFWRTAEEMRVLKQRKGNRFGFLTADVCFYIWAASLWKEQ